MSQTDADATDASTGSNDDSDQSLTEQVTAMRERLDALERSELADMDDLDLVELRTELKELEDRVEETRKEQADDVLEDRVDPGEKLYGLHRVESHSKYVDDDVGDVVMRAVSEGIDWTQFVSIDASDLADVAPEVADIGRYEYTYFR